MGEEQKKAEGEKRKEVEEEKPKAVAEEVKKEGGGEGDAASAPPPPPPPPPEEIVMRVYMHCEGCARKVRRSLKGFEGVEEVSADCRTDKVVVKGRKAAEDPLKVVERVQRKTGRKVELLTPLPQPKPEKKEEEEKKVVQEKPKPEEKKEVSIKPPVIAVVLKVHMHCEACAQEMKNRILKMKGVQAADPDLKASQVTVKGVFDPQKLVEYVFKRTGRHAVVVKTEPVEKNPEGEKAKGEANKDEKKAVDGENKDKAEGEKEKKAESGGERGEKGKDGGALDGAAAGDGGTAGPKMLDVKNIHLYYSDPTYPLWYAYPPPPPPPQIFSDENPNACSVM